MALTRVAPAGIGSTPGTGYVIGDSFLHSRGLNATDGYYTGIVTTQSLRVIGDLEVEGTTTTLDTALTEVDKLEVGANNSTVGLAVTQSGSGANSRFTGGYVDIDTAIDSALNLNATDDGPIYSSFKRSGSRIAYHGFGGSGNTFDIVNEATGGQFNISTPSDFKVRTNSSERLRITSAGNIGIGTVSPVAKLDIITGTGDGTQNEANCLRLRQRGINGNSMTLQMGVNPAAVGALNQGYAYLQGRFWGGGNNPILLNPKGGNVGIGRTQAYATLDVNGDTILRTAGQTTQGDIGRKLGFTGPNGTTNPTSYIAGVADKTHWYQGFGLVFGTVSGNDISATLGVERMRITSDGDVGIGTDNPFARVTVGATVNTSAFAIAGNLGNNNGRAFQILTPDTDSTTSPFRIQTGNSMLFQTDSNDCLYIGDLGHVGIHTLNPTFGQSTPISTYDPKFGVNGSIMIGNLSTTASDRSELQFYRRAGAYSQPIDTHDMGRIAWYGSSNDSNNSNLTWSIGVTPDGGSWTSGSNRKGYMTFNNHNGEQVRISSGGNVGINTNNPSQSLDVAGNTTIASNGRVNIYRPTSTATNTAFQINSNVGATDSIQFIVQTGGSVGIGTNNPSASLDVVSNDASAYIAEFRQVHASNTAQIIIDSPTDGASRPSYMDYATGGTVKWRTGLAYLDANRSFHIGTGSIPANSKLTIKPDGNVGINETSPDTYLHVKTGTDSALVKLEQTATNGRAQVQYLNPHGDWYQGIIGGTNTGDYLIYTSQAKNLTFYTSGELRQKIQSDGKVILGGNANQTANRDLSVVAAQGNSNEAQIGLQPTNSSGNYNPEVFISAIADGTYGAHMYFKTRDTSGNRLERLRIQSNGILRLSTPGNVLDGTFYASQTINNTGSNSYSRIRFDRSNVAKFGLTLRGDDKFCISNLFKNGSVSADDSAFVMTNTSNIGFGNATPDSKLHVYSTSNHAATFEYSSTSDCAIQVKNTQGSMFFGLGGNEGFGVATDSDINGSNNRFMILQDGKTGINNVSPPVRFAIADSNDVKMLLSSSWSGTQQILFGGGSSNSTGGANSTAAIIKCTSSAPSGQAVGQLQFIVNNGDNFDDDRLTIYPQGLGNAKTNGGPALNIRSGLSVSNPVASTALRIRPQFYDADCGAGFAYFQMSPSSSDSTPVLVWRFGQNVKMSGEIKLTLCSRTNSPVNARFDRLTAKYRFAFYGEGDNDGSGLRHLTEIYKDPNGCNIDSVSIVYVDQGHSQYGTNNNTWKDGYGYFKFNFSGLQGHAISCKIDLTQGMGYIHEAYFE